MRKKILCIILTILMLLQLTGCGKKSELDDYATNVGYENQNSSASTEATSKKIAKEDIKIGVIHLSDPAEGSGYSYTHDLGIQGMQENLGLSDSQIIRKVNVDDSSKEDTDKAIQDCIDEGCNIIFTTSWGYMDATAEFAEKYPDIYFCHGTGYKSNGKNFTNYFGRIYQARYLSGIVAGLNTKTNKIGYVAAQDSSNSEVTGGIDAFAMGIVMLLYMLKLRTAGMTRTVKQLPHRHFLIWAVMSWHSTAIHHIHRPWPRKPVYTVSVTTLTCRKKLLTHVFAV